MTVCKVLFVMNMVELLKGLNVCKTSKNKKNKKKQKTKKQKRTTTTALKRKKKQEKKPANKQANMKSTNPL